MNLKDTIFFYTRNDYLIINNLLCGNMEQLWEFAEISNGDSKCVLQEHKDGKRKLDRKSIRRYKNRIHETLDDSAKAKILATAKNDISNILGAMKRAGKQMLLYRMIPVGDPLRPVSVLSSYSINDTIEFKNISSTSVKPYREDAGFDFYRYEITVPRGNPVLKLDQFNHVIRNEDGEVLLPPMKCRVTSIRDSDNENCKGIIALEYLENLPTN